MLQARHIDQSTCIQDGMMCNPLLHCLNPSMLKSILQFYKKSTVFVLDLMLVVMLVVLSADLLVSKPAAMLVAMLAAMLADD